MKKIKLISASFSKQERSEEVQPNIEIIGAPEFWPRGNYGKGVVIAVLDTGCQIDHPDLRRNIIGGKNFTSDYNGDENNYSDNHYHGTHVAGIIAATLNNAGVVGVAPKASMLILKVLNGEGDGNYNSLINAIKYAIQWRGKNGEKVQIITMSLGGVSDNIELHEAVKQAVKNNILVVCAAGNNGDGNPDTDEKLYPGFYSEVVSVGAVNKNNKMAYFSNSNEEIDLVAPGVDIYSTYPENSYRYLSGTSMAAPHVAGAAALLICSREKELKRTLTENELFQLLCSKAKPIGYSRKEEGHGMICLM